MLVDAITMLVTALAAAIAATWKVSAWKRDMDRAMARIDKIEGDIRTLFERLPPRPVAGDSPIRLTEFGRSVAESMDADDWAGRASTGMAARAGCRVGCRTPGWRHDHRAGTSRPFRDGC